jgi:HSP20 family protein
MTILPRSSARAQRWDPSLEMDDIHDRFAHLMQSVFGEAGQATSRWPTLAVPADIEETEDAYIVDIDLPGILPGDVDVELRDSEVRISGEFHQRERQGTMRRQQRKSGWFEYLVMLPGDIDPDDVTATYTDGVLTLRVAKAAASQPRRIEVQSARSAKGAEQGAMGDHQRRSGNA